MRARDGCRKGPDVYVGHRRSQVGRAKVYEVIESFEVYEYDVTQYDPQTGQGGLFVDYINTFLNLKAVDSGYPDWVRTHEDEDRYIDNFYASEAIRLDRGAIRLNDAKRGLQNCD